MKVAILSPIAWSTPPKKYGPWEQVASNIAEGLIDKGIDVTLFATGDSSTEGKLNYVCNKPYAEEPEMNAKVWECLHISNLMEQASNFDIIHNHFDFLPLTYSGLIKTPLLTTIHGFSSQKILPVYKKYNDTNFYVSISNSDRSPELDYIATVYNGIDTENFNFNANPKDYLLFFGRIHPEKGTFESIKIAKSIQKRFDKGLDIIGFVDRKLTIETKDLFLPFLGAVSDLRDIIRTQNIHEVIFSTDSFSNEDILDIMDDTKDLHLTYRMVPRNQEVLLGKASVEEIGDYSFVNIEYNLYHRLHKITKRIFDIVLAVQGDIKSRSPFSLTLPQ